MSKKYKICRNVDCNGRIYIALYNDSNKLIYKPSGTLRQKYWVPGLGGKTQDEWMDDIYRYMRNNNIKNDEVENTIG